MDDRKVLRYDQDAVVALLDALYCLVWTKVLRDKVADCSLTIRATINPRLNYSNFFSIISFFGYLFVNDIQTLHQPLFTCDD